MDIEALQTLAMDALKDWDIPKPTLSLIKHRENTVFKITDETGKANVLRVHRDAYHSQQAIISELQWMAALKESDLNVPELIKTIEGQLFSKIPFEGSHRIIDVLSWVEGKTLADFIDDLSHDEIKSLYFQIGEVTAKLHQQASTWQLPENFKRHSWDVEGLVGDEPFWGRFWELEVLTAEQKEQVLEAKEFLLDKLSSYPKTSETYGLIHADMITDNLMLSEDDLYVIDFDDAGFGYFLFELATILRPIGEKAYFDIAKEALLDGYKGFRVLDEEDLIMLEYFGLARALTYLGWYNDRPELLQKTERVNLAIERVLNRLDIIIV